MNERQEFKGRSAFIFAAIGSAVGLGNIWRFPYVAYEGGGGAFIIPYLVALLTAGIPILFMDYAIGHKYRGSSPLSHRRINRGMEAVGWWHVTICFLIAIYYAVIIAWAIRYVGFSVNEAWGDDTVGFFVGDFLQATGDFTLFAKPVIGILIPLLIVWIFTLWVLRRGIQRGVARVSQIFIPLLVILFVILVVQALFQPGAMDGLNALFTPNWEALKDSRVWIMAYGQIFFSLSIAFGIMITYAAHLRRKTNLTASGLVVAFSNSSFEILAGIGVFSALGFMAQAQGVGVADVVKSGVGLAFMTFPAIISTIPGGMIFGVLFFSTLVLAGITSMVSIVEVVLDAFEDKFNMSRTASVGIVGGVMAVLSMLLFSTTEGLNLLDIIDNWANNFGVAGAGLVSVIAFGWLLRKLPSFRDHLNEISTFKVGVTWQVMLSVVTPLILGFMFISEIITRIKEGYGDMPTSYVLTYGWGIAIAAVVAAIILTLIPWPPKVVETKGLNEEEMKELV